jgi:hypothetical protein
MGRLLTLTILGALVAGCSTHGPIQAFTIAPDQAASLTVIRSGSWQGSGMTWVITVDGQDVLGIRYGEHATVAIPSGRRVIPSDCVTAFPLVRPGRAIVVTPEPGGHVYVNLGACELTELTATSGAAMVQQTKAQ